jgi:hypothetical protein
MALLCICTRRLCSKLTGNTSIGLHGLLRRWLYFMCRWRSYLTGNTLMCLHVLLLWLVSFFYIFPLFQMNLLVDSARFWRHPMKRYFVRFEAFTLVTMKNGVSWDVTLSNNLILADRTLTAVHVLTEQKQWNQKQSSFVGFEVISVVGILSVENQPTLRRKM